MRRLLFITTSLLALAAVAAVTRAGDAPAAAGDVGDGITVQGSAAVKSVPDRAQVSFGVDSQAATAKAALAANAVEMRRVIAALKEAGAVDVRTQYVSLSPRYSNGGDLQGYSAQNTVSATLTDLAKAGAVIDAAVAAGANQVYGPALTTTDRSELYRQALRAAVANARANAQALAASANVSLGKVTAIVEGYGAPMPVALEAAKAQPAATSTPIEPGQQETAATVTVTFSVT